MTVRDPNVLEPVPPADAGPRRMTWVAWGLLGVSLVVVVILAAYVSHLATRMGDLEAEVSSQAKQRKALLQQRNAARAESSELKREKEKLGTELEQTQADKEAAKKELEQARQDLAAQLATEIKRGEVFILVRGSELVVDVADKVLFDTGKIAINERGQEVLRQVAITLNKMPGHVFQVGGHTDAARIVSADVREHFPTNWELSAARATNVVRFLSEKCGVPGRQLVAAAYARYRPVASNQTAAGKQRNRRIEIALLKKLPPQVVE